MEPQPKSKTGLIAALTLIVGLLAGAAGVFFWKDGELAKAKQSVAEKDQKIVTLEKQTSLTDCIKGVEIDDELILKSLTEEQMKGSGVATYWLPIIHKIHEDYASTSPLPIVYSQDRGYEVPGMGGVNYFWHKKDGAWKRIGQCTETGCEMEAGYTYEGLPKELTH